MKNYLKMTRDGFTLVELMIVVAIIGVLASIAVPQYSKFQAKSRQSEVKIQLGATYTVEQSFAAENSTYTTCLGQVGYNRDGNKFYYTVGFGATPTAAAVCAPGGASGSCLTYQWTFNAASSSYSAGSSCAVAAASTNFPANISEPGTAISTASDLDTGGSAAIVSAISSSTFTIGGAGNILSKSSNPKMDGWIIDNNKQIQNVQSGLQ